MKLKTEKITVALLALCCSVVAGAAFVCLGNYFIAAVFMLVSVVLFFRVLSIYRTSHEKIDFMFNALECNDYSFSFPEFDKDVNQIAINALLNRIKGLLAEAKQQTIEREKYYEYIFDQLNTAVVILNEKGDILQANRAMYHILGVEILGHVNHIAKVSQPLSVAIVKCSDGETDEVTISSESGDKVYSVMASHISFNNKELKIVAISSIDSALDRKEIESWSKLTRIMTHEIMNSLSPITSLSQTLLAMNRDDRLQQGLETIAQTNKSLISFVENYRSFTTIQKPVKHPFEIKPLIENILRLILPTDVECTLDIEPEDTMIFADENQILQIMVNLLKNAVHAIEGNSKKLIDVKVFIREDENIVIEVSNNGPQIAAEVVENLFLPFFTTRKGGKGVGLTISKRIMQLHGGSLTLTTNTSKRVTFTLLFR